MRCCSGEAALSYVCMLPKGGRSGLCSVARAVRPCPATWLMSLSSLQPQQSKGGGMRLEPASRSLSLSTSACQ